MTFVDKSRVSRVMAQNWMDVVCMVLLLDVQRLVEIGEGESSQQPNYYLIERTGLPLEILKTRNVVRVLGRGIPSQTWNLKKA